MVASGLASCPEGSFPPGRPESRAWLPWLLGATALASSCPGSESLSSFPGQAALNLFLLIQELYL